MIFQLFQFTLDIFFNFIDIVKIQIIEGQNNEIGYKLSFMQYNSKFHFTNNIIGDNYCTR